MTGSHEVRGSIPLGSTTLPLIIPAQCDYSVTVDDYLLKSDVVLSEV